MDSALSSLMIIKATILIIGVFTVLVCISAIVITGHPSFLISALLSGFSTWILYSFFLGFINIVQAAEIYIKKNMPEETTADE